MEAHVEEQEIDFQQAVDEEADTRPRPGPPQPEVPPTPQNFDQAAEQQSDVADSNTSPEPTEEERQAAQMKEDMEIIVPKDKPRMWKLGPDNDAQRQYIQEELSVIGEIQWFALLGDFLDKAMSGDSAVSLNALLSPPQRSSGTYRMQDLQDADTFVHALGKLVAFAPEFMEKSICIWLSVPDYEWDLVREYMKQSPSRGGMSHDMFEEIIATFIDQNYTAIDRFFRERFGRLRARYQARQKEASQSRSSKR